MGTTGDAADLAAELRDLPFGVRFGLARSPATRPDDLQALYHDSTQRSARKDEEKLVAAIASNPNTSPRLLATLAPKYPDAFCANPVAPLLVLEEPGFLEWLTESHLGLLLQRGDAPATFALLLAGHSSIAVREAARLHVAAMGEAELNWQEELRTELIALARRQTSDDPAARTALHRMIALDIAPDWLLDGNDPNTAAAALPPPALRPALRTAFLCKAIAERGESLAVCRCFALAQATPSINRTTLAQAALSPRWTDRLGIALNPTAHNILPDAYGALCDDGNRFVRAAARAVLTGSLVAI